MDKKSKGHALFTDKFEYFYSDNGDLWRVPKENPIELSGYKSGSRFEATKASAALGLDLIRSREENHGKQN